ncbi:Uncharacterised protein [Vibrio cholerae]|nr:Uncharacterised protein [Vibrio cholerae]
MRQSRSVGPLVSMSPFDLRCEKQSMHRYQILDQP